MKRVIVIILVIIMAITMVGCASGEDVLNSNIAALEEEVAELKAERDAIKDEIADIKIENGTAKYVVTFNIKQIHFTLDLGQHLKDEMNDISIQIPVDKEYYDSIEVGDVINDDFRMGSLIFKGSFGNWNVTVEDKCVR